MKDLVEILAKSVFIQLGLTAAGAATVAVRFWIGYDYTTNNKGRNE